MQMESENGVQMEEEKSGFVGSTNEDGSVNNSEQASNENGISESSKGTKETLKTSGVGSELSRTNSNTKTRNSRKKGSEGNTSLKNNKSTRNQDNLGGSTLLARKPKASLTQSLSFPSRGSHPDGMRRSTDAFTMKSGSKHSQTNGRKSEVTLSNGAINKRTALASLPCLRQSLSSKSISTNGIAKKAISEESVNQNPKSVKTSVLAKGDDDARSTTSSSATPCGQQRTSVTGFSFRLEERAEKRKEFFSKLEEKIHAKEAEKCNLQARSKESQEAEIKQLRKSLAFKATPMPSFYKEPPPKVDLKKIPTTRPISPKLGRPKNTTSDSSENGATCISPKGIAEKSKSPNDTQANGDKGSTASKKLLKRSPSKPQYHESLAAKTDGKSCKTKPKATEVQDAKACIEKSEDIQNEATHSAENFAEDNEPTLTSSNPEHAVPVAS
ncbi:hypothetical protein ACH5RR_005715 [Cinchona calisaya]|uniref:TPX2 C-terminal domain-containing protein n=1 Tax=Cinchona calisaya TaxID=153742 RepID=A0ABD3ALZ4_9GENT